MVVKKDVLREYSVKMRHAKNHALNHLHMAIYSKSLGTPWMGVRLAEPMPIYDMNSEPLFYDFPAVSSDGAQLGTVRASANRVIGEPVPSVFFGEPRADVGRAILGAQEIVRKKYRGRMFGTRMVCYAYPKVGILVSWENRRGEGTQTLFDVGDLSVVPESVESGLRGPGVWSVYDTISPRTVRRNVKRYGDYDKVLGKVKRRSKLDLSQIHSIEDFQSVQSAVAVVVAFFTTKIVTFCTHSYSHECYRMHAQENGYYCVVATGQMILDFWRYYLTQNQIATAMGTTTGGTGYAGEVNGLEALTCSHFDAASDMSPTFAKVKTEINANRPFDYSYSYHAMACAGYRQQNIALVGTTPVRSVYLYDPSPVNVGAIRWETWGSGISAVDGFVYLRRS